MIANVPDKINRRRIRKVKVFLKYISHSMLEKKGRFFMMLFSIAVSAALLVASLGMVDVVMDSLNAPYEAGHLSDLMITSRKDDPYMKEGDIKDEGLKDVVYLLQTTGVINENDKIKYVSLQGRKAYEGNMIEGNTDFLAEKKAADQPSCIISKRIADSLNLGKGSTISLYLAGNKVTFQVTAISANENLFYGDTKESFNLLVPYEFLNGKMQADGGYNVALANVKEGEASAFADSFNEANKDYNAVAHSSSAIGNDSITLGLYFMMAIVAIVSAIIIHGVFKLILTERMATIGTFMSQGATKKKVERIILGEGFLYGLFGGLVGCVIGEVLLFFLGRMVSPLAEYEIYTPFKINPVHIAVGIIFAVTLSTISAYFPVRSIRKLQTKDVILNRVDHTRKNRIVKPLIGIVLLAFSTVVFFLYKDMPSFFGAIGFVTAYTGIILLTPAAVKYIAGALSKVVRGNTTLFLTLNNIRSSKLLRNNIVLIVVSFSSVLMIASFGKSMTALVEDAYKKMDYDFSISNIMEIDPNHSTTDMILEKLDSIEGIEKNDVDPVYYLEGTVDGETAIVTGINPDSYETTLDKYFGFTTTYKKDYQALKDSDDCAVVLTTKVADKINKKVGDTVTMKVNSIEVPFRVAGIYDGLVYNSGISVLIKGEIMKKEFHAKEASEIYVRASKPEAAEKAFKSYLASLGSTYSTNAEDMKLNDENNQIIVMVMSIFSYLAMIIASIGVFNNIAICFFQRKREFAVMTSLGMDRSKRRNLLFSESLMSVVFSILISIPFTILLSGMMTAFTIFIGLPMVIEFTWVEIPKYALIITAIILVASVSSMMKSKKLSVVQELKYE